ncbi:Pleiotropic drug resistance protein TUR2 [Vitis vinifera]|uniref:Pleiotropic drug resistance protein TUR2 n=1 Tax=Vitis vinifera TaxID=29760 RepID=A0A438D9N2_VITVI|nr:Pleiotropic drug resistance protein TUR2 [Vitis vinifera]
MNWMSCCLCPGDKLNTRRAEETITDFERFQLQRGVLRFVLKLARVLKLPTYNRLKKGLLKGSEGDFGEVDIQNLGSREKKNLLERLVKTAVLKVHQDFLHNQTSFYDFLIMGFRVASIFFRVGIVLPEVEVRFEHLTVTGKVTYNGHGMEEFVPQRIAAYIGQHDNHIGEMTVRETLAFSAICQGVGFRYEMLAELARREKEANIKPDPDIDVFMKILGLDVCADTMVGNAMLRGISGGQKKRITTGEMLVGPATVLFMDEISTGLDSSTTYQILLLMAFVGFALFLRVQMHRRTVEDGNVYASDLFFTVIAIMFNGMVEIVLIIENLVSFTSKETYSSILHGHLLFPHGSSGSPSQLLKLLFGALQGVSPTALRRLSRRFRRRVSGALMGRAAAAASDAIPGGTSGAAGALFRCAAGALFRRAGGSLVVRASGAPSSAVSDEGRRWAPLQALRAGARPLPASLTTLLPTLERHGGALPLCRRDAASDVTDDAAVAANDLGSFGLQ